METIPYGRHFIDEDDIARVVEVLRGPSLTQGPVVTEFERAVAARCGARHAVACSSGTAALHIALLAGRVGPGDEVIGPAISFLATSNCALYAGATPTFCDVDFDSVRMTAALLESHLHPATRAIVPVHFSGWPCNMEEIAPLVRERCPQALIIEDASHALGGTHEDRTPVGSLTWADMVVFSFHPVKHVAAGEGGMILTDRADLAERARLLRNHGMTKEQNQLTRADEGPWYYEMHELGFNYRIADINCALGLSQLAKLDGSIARRRRIAARYLTELSTLPHTTLPPSRSLATSAWHLFVLHIDFAGLGKPRGEVVSELSRRGIGTQVHYYPIPLQPLYRHRFGYQPGEFPLAERHYTQALTIPLYPTMTDEEVGRVTGALREVVR